MRIILASESQSRVNLMTQAGFTFEAIAADIDEAKESAGLSPVRTVETLSAKKAETVARFIDGECVIIAADTIIVLDGRVIGKPKDADDAIRTLSDLQGRGHIVLTGVTIVVKTAQTTETRMFTEEARVFFRPLSVAEISAFVATGLPFGKSGSYTMQGLGSTLVRRVEGDFYGVIGLPLAKIAETLTEFGIFVLK